jgi:hypothetical protein
LFLYNETIVNCIADSTLSAQQMAELTNMWYQAYSLEQQGLLNNTWYIVGIIFIILFGLLLLGIIVYCAVKSYEGSVSESPFEDAPSSTEASGTAPTKFKKQYQYSVRPYPRAASSLKTN